MMWFKIICLTIDEHTPASCSLVAGCVFPKGAKRAMPPHCEGCLCTIEPTEQPGLCDPVLVDMKPSGLPNHSRVGRCIQVPLKDTTYSPFQDTNEELPRFEEPPLLVTEPADPSGRSLPPELPCCACSLCEKCGQSNWVYKGKLGCGNTRCEDYAMGEAHKMYCDSLKDVVLDSVARDKYAKWFQEPFIGLAKKFMPDMQIVVGRYRPTDKPIYVLHRNKKEDLWTYERTVGTEDRAIQRCEELKEFYKYTMYSTKLPKKYWS